MADWKVLRAYKGESLREVMMPIGGIGTGFFGIDGRGRLTDWQLMSRPNRGWRPMYSHLALWTRRADTKDESAKLRILEGDLVYGRANNSGQEEVLAGVPRFRDVSFEATYPFGRLKLSDPATPLSVEVEAFNPLIPGDTASSSLPFGLLTITVTNQTNEGLDASVSFLASNIIGCDGVVFDLKDNVTEIVEVAGWKGMAWSKARDLASPQNGTLVALSDGSDVRTARRWAFRDRGWNGEQLGIIDELLAKGYIEDDLGPEPCPPSPSDTWDSSVHSLFRVGPKEKKSVRLLIAWHFPWRNMKEYGWDWKGKDGELVRNHYATLFRDATDVAMSVLPQLAGLKARTAKFTDSVVARKVPTALKEAALFNLATLNSHTCFRIEDGTFMASEGCGSKSGCCHGSCTHVWNYEEATVNLFPDLHRSMLESHLKNGMTPIGAERFRLTLPMAQQSWGAAAADGQMGLIVRVYQQFLKDGDLAWLRTYYPVAKKMLEYAWLPGGWDADKDGVMEGYQHNTYDVEFVGPNPMCTSYYHAAMAAVAKMARTVGDDATAEQLDALRKTGRDWVDKNLYNGEYYEQRVEVPEAKPAELSSLGGELDKKEPVFQIGRGCLVDQLVGQYKANRVGLGTLFDGYHVRNAVHAVYKHNFMRSFRDHYNNMRTFATADEKGTLIASYPRGGRPKVPFPYWGECMTGFEYQAAVLLMDYGFKDEGLEVAAAVRERHAGHNRNPFNEPECGSYYARAMAAWALLDAWEAGPVD
ncbi:MAG: hypothetical protein JST30_04835 [Armatimonadetes bacterium]|nr:hypothetical protein [Armatimonadota bacterium]